MSSLPLVAEDRACLLLRVSGRILRSSTALNLTGLSGHGSVLDRSRCAGTFVSLELTARLGRFRSLGFGIGSVGRGGSVVPAETRSASWAFSHRTSLSELLKSACRWFD